LRTLVFLLTISSGFLTLCGCRFSALTSHSPIYTKPLLERIVTLDPTKTRFRPDYMIARAIEGQLLSLDSVGAIKPSLIESWEVNREGTDYLFHIRQGVTFHSGRKATLDDVVFTFHYLASKDSLISQLFSDIEGFDEYFSGKAPSIKGIKPVGITALRVKLKTPSFVFLVNLADPKVAVVPDQLRGKSPEEFFLEPDGIGPFRLTRMSRDGAEIELEANSLYFGGPPKLSRIRFIQMTMGDAVQAYRKGKVHDLELFSLPQKDHASLSLHGNVFSVAAYSTSFLFFNGRKTTLKNLSVRKQIARALDVSPLAKQCDMPYLKATGFIPQGVLGWSDPQYHVVNTPVRLKNIKIKTPLVLISYGEDYPKCMVEGFVNQLVAAGIPIKYEHLTSSNIVERLENGSYDLFFEYLSVRGSEPFHLLSYFYPHSKHNITWFNDSAISDFGNQIKASPARQVRATLYRQLSHYMNDQHQYFVPLFSDVRHYFFAESVKGPTVPAMITMNNGFEEISLE
jgi:ABC-type transport system substrate-binding protein